MYNDPKCKPWTSTKWAPAGYTSRYDLAEQTKAAQAGKPLAEPSEEKQIEHAAAPASPKRKAVPEFPENRERTTSQAALGTQGGSAEQQPEASGAATEEVDRSQGYREGHAPGDPGYPVPPTKSGPRGGFGELV